jgi:hypothetical protein
VLSQAKVEAFINRARAAFRRAPHSPYLAGCNLLEDFDKLGLYAFEDQCQAVSACLQEIKSEFYAGPEPPNHIGCEPVCRGERLLQFVWTSNYFRGKRMCFKFAIKSKRQSDERLAVVRLHDTYDPNKFAKLDRR